MSDPDAERIFLFRARPYGLAEDPFDVFTEVMAYNLAGVVGQIRTPLLITNPADEQFWPGQSEQLAGAITGEKQVLTLHRRAGRQLALPAAGPAADQQADARLAGRPARRRPLITRRPPRRTPHPLRRSMPDRTG